MKRQVFKRWHGRPVGLHCITGNDIALYFAGAFIDSEKPGVPQQPSAAPQARAAPKPEPGHERNVPVSRELVEAIQRKLTQRGYNPGTTDGQLDIRTRAAIIAYEFDEGLPLRGKPSEAVLKSLIFGAAAGKAGPGPADRFERRRDLVMQVQKKLAGMGHFSGAIDGRFDARTQDAIRRFENERDLRGSGQLTARILLELIVVSGHPFETVS